MLPLFTWPGSCAAIGAKGGPRESHQHGQELRTLMAELEELEFDTLPHVHLENPVIRPTLGATPVE